MAKITKNGKLRRIAAADESSARTVFYRITQDDVWNVYESNNTNLFVQAAFQINGFEAFDINRMWGSAIIDDVLYLCQTDGKEIMVNGTLVYPEDAIEDVGIDALSEFIQDADPDIILHNLSSDELDRSKLDVNEVAASLIQDGNKFLDVVREAYDADLIDSLL